MTDQDYSYFIEPFLGPNDERHALIVPADRRYASGGYISDEAHAEIVATLQRHITAGLLCLTPTIPYVSTASDTPAPELDSSIVDKLKQTLKRLREEDPLLQRGIQPDWVCVVHPRLVYLIEQEFPGKRIDEITRRRVWRILDAPEDRVEYMPFAVMVKKYARTFKALAELAITEEMRREFKKVTMQARRAMADAECERNNGQGI